MTKKEHDQEEFLNEVDKDVKKKIQARSQRKEVMFGLGFFGVVGWSVAVPTVLSTYLGIYLDKRFPSNFSWTLTFIFIGVIFGSLNTWFWLKDNGERKNKKD